MRQGPTNVFTIDLSPLVFLLCPPASRVKAFPRDTVSSPSPFFTCFPVVPLSLGVWVEDLQWYNYSTALLPELQFSLVKTSRFPKLTLMYPLKLVFPLRLPSAADGAPRLTICSSHCLPSHLSGIECWSHHPPAQEPSMTPTVMESSPNLLPWHQIPLRLASPSSAKLIKLKSFCTTVETMYKMKRQPTKWKKYLQTMLPTRD